MGIPKFVSDFISLLSDYLSIASKFISDYIANPFSNPFLDVGRFILVKLNLYFYYIVKFLIELVGAIFGFPVNPGLPYGFQRDKEFDQEFLLREVLARYTRQIENITNPKWGATMRKMELLNEKKRQIPDIPANMFEVIFSKIPAINPIQRVFFMDKETGFYNFYVQDYINIQTLPDWFSELIQIKFELHMDYSPISIIRECLFGIVWVFSEIYQIRGLMTLFIFLNPYVFPWLILTILVDWLEEMISPYIPQGIAFIELNQLSVRIIIGATLDNLNNLVLTFPYLPSEGKPEYILDGAETGPAIVFRGLPKLWYKHGIPNDIRQHWYYERQDIFTYFQQAYKSLDIQFLPDEIIEEINSQKTMSIPKIESIPVPISDTNYLLENFHHLFNHNLQLEDFFRNIFNFFNKLIY